ncbi:MAG: Panacea domain-containing protein [Patescibacteria group bacterium]
MSQINEKKYQEVILYLAEKLGGEIKGKKKLAKLLYFVDFDFYEKYEKSLTGDIYKALPMGPFPITMEKILLDLAKQDKIIISNIQERDDYNPTEIYHSTEKLNNNLSVEEKQILDQVILKYGNLSGKQLEDLTHAEAPYIGTEPNAEIAYELAFYRGSNSCENA